jgi:hypothetical protein
MMQKIKISTVCGMRWVMADVYGPVAVHGEVLQPTDPIVLSTERFVVVHVASGGRLTSWTTFSLESAQIAAQELSEVKGWECMDRFIGADPCETQKVREVVPPEFRDAVAEILKAAVIRDEERAAA